ncbi:MAG: nitroreductase family protein [Candidatus Bathyarchaeota archaeon]|nr:nitroreductase family protein [Candidatus Termiticorpusculum sp.]
MEVFEAVKNRRSIRQFTNQPIPEEMVNKLVEAARMAPYCWECPSLSAGHCTAN